MPFLFRALSIYYLVALSSTPSWATVDTSADFYRSLVQQLRMSESFTLALPQEDVAVSYSIRLTEPLPGYELPKVLKTDYDPQTPETFIVDFLDRIGTDDTSIIKIKNQEIAVSCIFVHGLDYRQSGRSSLLSPFVIKLYVVGNDSLCRGPLNPNWPSDGQRKDSWANYIFYTIRNTASMLPQDATLRYNWNDYQIQITAQP